MVADLNALHTELFTAWQFMSGVAETLKKIVEKSGKTKPLS